MRKNQRIDVIVFMTLTLLIMLGCTQQKKTWQGTIETVDGITIVKNPQPIYNESVFTLEEELTIGEENSETENLFEVIIAVRVDAQHNIYILDNKACKVRVFSEEGKYLAKVSLRGHPACWDNGKLYSIETDEKGYEYVKRYKVIWGM